MKSCRQPGCTKPAPWALVFILPLLDRRVHKHGEPVRVAVDLSVCDEHRSRFYVGTIITEKQWENALAFLRDNCGYEGTRGQIEFEFVPILPSPDNVTTMAVVRG